MSQEFHVVRCFKCETFQVQQVKKAKRWSCKLCGEKQSLLKDFGRGSGADCRRHVQKLNAMRGAAQEERDPHTSPPRDQVQGAEEQNKHMNCHQLSRWSKYLDPPEEEEPEEVRSSSSTIDRRKRSPVPEEVCVPRTKRSNLDSDGTGDAPGATGLLHRTTCPAPRWAGSLSSDLKEVKVPSVGGVTRQRDAVRRQTGCSSMFESGEDFSIDD